LAVIAIEGRFGGEDTHAGKSAAGAIL
jgi:hypothetical protein